MSFSNWIETVKRWKKKWPLYLEEYEDDSNGINLYTFIEIINEHMSGNNPIVCDAGSAIYVPSQNLKMKEGQKYILSGAQADMGFAVPASIGVSLADKNKNVLVFTGDGSFNTNIQELATIRNHNLPIKIFVWNNDGYLSIMNTQKKFYEGRIYGTSSTTGLWFPSLKKIADSYDFQYYKFDKNIDLRTNIEEILIRREPTIIEIICQKEQEIVPSLMLKKDLQTGYNLQCGLHDMYPFLSQDEIIEEMFDEKNN